MWRRMKESGLLLGLLLLAGCGGGAPSSSSLTVPTGTVQGRLAPASSRQAGAFLARVHGLDAERPLVTQVQADGTFRIEGVPVGEQVITVENDAALQGAVVVAQVRPNEVTDVGEVRPRSLGQLTGIVAEVDEAGNRVKPIPRARIVARPLEGAQDTLQELPGRPFFVAFSDGNGSYRLLLPPGDYLVEASHPDYQPSTDQVSIAALQTTSLDIGLLPRPKEVGTVSGKVEAQVEGQTVPVPGALVALIPRWEVPLPILEGEELPLEPEHLTVGHIVSTLQNPMRGGHRQARPLPWRPLFTFTDALGRYQLTNVPAGDYTATAFKQGYTQAEQQVTVRANETVEVNFLLQATLGSLRGQVTDANTGQPLERALVYATRWGDPWFGWETWEEDKERPHHFVPRPLALRGRSSDESESEVEEGDEGSILEPEPSPGEGATGGGIVVPIMPPIEPPMRAGTLTDSNGNYHLSLPPGEYFLTVVKEGYEWQAVQVTVQLGQTMEVNFALKPLGSSTPPSLGTGLRLGLRVDSPVRAGETVTMHLKVANPGPQPVTLTFPTSQHFDFSIVGPEGEMWRWSHGMAFAQVLTSLTLQPGEEREFEVEWNQRTHNGRPVPPGNYRVHASLTTQSPLSTEAVSLIISP